MQFARGYGRPLLWIADPVLLRNAQLELHSREDLVSSHIVGLFDSSRSTTIVFQQDNYVGIYFLASKKYSLLSRKNDFFEAGLEFSASDSPASLAAKPTGELVFPPSAQLDEIAPEKANEYINLPSNNSLLFVPDPTKTPKNELHTPSFFSPPPGDHPDNLYSHDPRIHAAPLHLTRTAHSQFYPTTPDCVSMNRTSPFSTSGRDYNLSRSQSRTSEAPQANITPISHEELANLLKSQKILSVDIRPFAAYAKSRLVDAVNVCIPTVLLKRSTLSLDDISEIIVSGRGRFAKWKEADGIVIYDADSLRVKDSYRLATLAAKFLEAGFERTTYGVIGSFFFKRIELIPGGFSQLMDVPSLVDTSHLTDIKSPSSSPTTPKFLASTVTTKPAAVDATRRLALGCKESQLFTRNSTRHIARAAEFFSNIRPNMGLHGGISPVIPINAPKISSEIEARLPKWLAEVAYSPDGPQILACRLETIELAEKQRLESVFSGDGMQGRFSVSAAMERWEKNRYSNIWPFEWNRVRIPLKKLGQDYFNGSYIRDARSGRQYIATQAPMPGTFEDFWKVIWGEGVQLIVCLAAINEGGQVCPFYMIVPI